MKVKAYVTMGLVGCKREEILDLDDDLSDEDIDESVKEWMFNVIEWSWKKQEEKPS